MKITFQLTAYKCMNPRSAKFIGLIVLFLSSWLDAPIVLADVNDYRIEPDQGVLSAEFASTYKSEEHDSLWVISPLFGGIYRFKSMAVALDWGFASLLSMAEKGEDESTFRPGNPRVSALYFNEFGNTYWRLGLGITAPLASIDVGPEGRLQSATYNYAMGMRGEWDAWLWAPWRMSVEIPFKAGVELGKFWRLEGEASAAVLVPAKSHQGDSRVFLQIAGEAGYQINPVELGTRIQAVFMPGVESDQAQFSFVPKVSLQMGAFFAFLGVTANLDDPLGGELGMDRWGLISEEEAYSDAFLVTRYILYNIHRL